MTDKPLCRAVWIKDGVPQRGHLIDFATALDEVQHLRELDRFAWLEDAECNKVSEEL